MTLRLALLFAFLAFSLLATFWCLHAAGEQSRQERGE
jgi:hypothetical protein